MSASTEAAQPSAGYYVRNATGLVREISSWATLFIVFNWTIGTGIQSFAVTVIGTYPGSNPILAFLISAIMVFATATSTYLLSVAMPRSGGVYVHVSRIMHPLLGYVAGWLYFLYGIFGAVAINSYLAPTLLAGGLRAAGAASHNPSLVNVANQLVDPVTDVIFGAVTIVFYTILLSLGYTALKAVIYATFWIPLIGSIFTIIGFGFVNPSQVNNLWDSVFGTGAFQQMVQSATTHGWKPADVNFSLSATFLGLIPAIYAWTGPALAGGLMAGEVRKPKRSLFVGTIGTGIIVLIFQLLYVGGAINAFGYQFIQQVDFGGPALKFAPGIPLFAAVAWSQVSYIGVIIVTLGALSAMHTQPAAIFLTSRVLFGMSFDRTMPAKMSEVSKRTIAPIYNYIVIAIIGLIVMYVASPLTPYGIYLTLGWTTFVGILALVLINLAAIMFPYSRRDLFKSADSIVSKTVGGIPVIIISGIIGFVGYFFALLVDAAGISGSALGISGLMIPTIVIAIGIIFYTYYASKNLKAGIDVNVTYREIPPE